MLNRRTLLAAARTEWLMLDLQELRSLHELQNLTVNVAYARAVLDPVFAEMRRKMMADLNDRFWENLTRGEDANET